MVILCKDLKYPLGQRSISLSSWPQPPWETCCRQSRPCVGSRDHVPSLYFHGGSGSRDRGSPRLSPEFLYLTVALWHSSVYPPLPSDRSPPRMESWDARHPAVLWSHQKISHAVRWCHTCSRFPLVSVRRLSSRDRTIDAVWDICRWGGSMHRIYFKSKLQVHSNVRLYTNKVTWWYC